MKIPLANAIFDGKLNIEDFHKNKKETKIEFENLRFEEVNPKIFPTISLKKLRPVLNPQSITSSPKFHVSHLKNFLFPKINLELKCSRWAKPWRSAGRFRNRFKRRFVHWNWISAAWIFQKSMLLKIQTPEQVWPLLSPNQI